MLKLTNPLVSESEGQLSNSPFWNFHTLYTEWEVEGLWLASMFHSFLGLERTLSKNHDLPSTEALVQSPVLKEDLKSLLLATHHCLLTMMESIKCPESLEACAETLECNHNGRLLEPRNLSHLTAKNHWNGFTPTNWKIWTKTKMVSIDLTLTPC